MQSSLGASKMVSTKENKVVLPAIRDGMHAACTSVGLRMDTAAKADQSALRHQGPCLVTQRGLDFILGCKLIRSMGGLGNGCDVIGENTVGSPCEDEVFDG